MNQPRCLLSNLLRSSEDDTFEAMFRFFKKKGDERWSKTKVKALIKIIHETTGYVYSVNDLAGCKAYEDLKKLTKEEQKTLILQLCEVVRESLSLQAKSGFDQNQFPYYYRSIAFAIQSGLLRRKLNYSETEWIQLFKSFIKCVDQLTRIKNFHFTIYFFPISYAIKQIEYYLKNNDLSENLSAFITKLLQWLESHSSVNNQSYRANHLKTTKKLKTLLLGTEGAIPAFNLQEEDIGYKVNQVINSITENREAFFRIFDLASTASSARPSQKFSQKVTELQDQIGLETFKKTAHQILNTALTHQPYSSTTAYEYHGRTHEYTETTFLSSTNQQFIKGMVWTLVRFSDKETIQILTRLCEKSYTKIPGKGPAAASLGNACIFVLGNTRGKDGLGALSRLQLNIRHNQVKKVIDKYLLEGANKYNVSVEELKEMAVPDFNLKKGGKIVPFGDYSLKVFVEGRKVHQQWVKPDGTSMKSVPGIVKKTASLSKKLKEVRKEVKEIQKVFAAQKQRIDNQFILDRTWDYPSFQKYYLQHGLVYPITQKLIWTLSNNGLKENAIFLDDTWYTLEHDPIDWVDEKTTVKLWHPVFATEQTIIKWREKMMSLEWKQPIKQAFREIYILTDAELNTRTYSNRMAAHILKQHQFNSLAKLRGWKYSLMGAFDDGRDNEICHKYLPEFNITAEYWIDELYQEDGWNETGIWLYIATDQVKFKDEQGQPVELVNVPKIVFTEIMRDVDMFVGVCSVGNDPQWMDNNGERRSNRDYWTSFSFGDLTEIAKTRKSILERLLPRLKKIRNKASIEGRFLVVKGQLRTYKIHIGSGNILMEPNDQYLCIVPARSAENTTDRIFIPFEGDKGLSIVLSKAFLLAEDDKIADTSITSQIRER